MKNLEQLLLPLTLEEFLAEYWTKKAIHISTDDRQKFQAIFNWKDLNYLLNYHRLTAANLQFSQQGKSLEIGDPRNWSDRIRQGATLILNGVHHRVPAVMQLAANLRCEIGYETHVNLYCSPGQQQGFDCHYDTHDVLILQIDGEKKWFVYRETVLYPTPEMPSSKETQPTEPPYLECVLKPGDLLYIPRGQWHYAIACQQQSPSLHLTVGIECQTGLDWLSWLIDELQQHPQWRQSLPAMVNANRQVFAQQLTQLRQGLIETLDQPDLVDRYLDALSYRHHPPLPINLPTQIGTDIFPDLFLTRYAWSPLHRIRIKQLGEANYQIQIGSKRIDLKGIPETLAENLFNQDEFSLSDVADWSPDLDLEADIAPLITQLVKEGVLHVKPADGNPSHARFQ
jgi:ribosomal protein L16 Arg81 hydroxylase